MDDSQFTFTPPRNKALLWLINPGTAVSPRIAAVLLGEIFTAPKAVIAGAGSSLIIYIIALALHGGRIFGVFMVVEAAVYSLRFGLILNSKKRARHGVPSRTELYFLSGFAYCVMQGVVAFTAMRSNIHALQLLCVINVMGHMSPTLVRSYAAPRYTLLQVFLIVAPFLAAATFQYFPWLLPLLIQLPLGVLTTVLVLKRFQRLALATMESELDSRERANRDSLTGLFNRAGLMEGLDHLAHAGTRHFTLFYLDLDGFKPINDVYGHQAGDQVLQLVARRLSLGMRAGDLLSRLGGDEFVVVAPDMRPSESENFAARIIHSVADDPYTIDSAPPVRIGISVGFACAPEDGMSGDDLHRKADAALYEAKRAGKGTHRRFDSTAPQAAGLATPHRRDKLSAE